MKAFSRIAGICILLSTAVMACPVTASGAETSVNTSAAVRVGYVESEGYYAFTRGLTGIGEALLELGLIDHFEADYNETDSRKVWQALSEARGDKLKFVQDMHFSMKSMGERDYANFINNGEVDIVFVMGTSAGIYFKDHETKNDFMVFAAADPIKSGIVKSVSERFIPNSYAYIDPSRFLRQIEIAYNMFHFSKLGVVYENNKNAYTYSGIEQLEQSAAENGFEIVTLHVNESLGQWDNERYYRELKDAYHQLARQIDALYITTATTEDYMLPWLLEDVYSAGVATISQVGESQVQNGVVLGVTLDDPKDQGRFIARQISKYLDGISVDKLEQIYEITPKFFINYDAATRTGLKIPMQTLLMSDEIYRTDFEEKKNGTKR